jgi:hypothetical protein
MSGEPRTSCWPYPPGPRLNTGRRRAGALRALASALPSRTVGGQRLQHRIGAGRVMFVVRTVAPPTPTAPVEGARTAYSARARQRLVTTPPDGGAIVRSPPPGCAAALPPTRTDTPPPPPLSHPLQRSHSLQRSRSQRSRSRALALTPTRSLQRSRSHSDALTLKLSLSLQRARSNALALTPTLSLQRSRSHSPSLAGSSAAMRTTSPSGRR